MTVFSFLDWISLISNYFLSYGILYSQLKSVCQWQNCHPPRAINRLIVITADSRLIGCCMLLYVRKIITTFSLLSCLFTLRFHLATQNKRKKPLHILQGLTSINVIITQVWYCFYTAVPKTRSYYQVTDLLETMLSDILFIFAAAAKKVQLQSCKPLNWNKDKRSDTNSEMFQCCWNS